MGPASSPGVGVPERRDGEMRGDLLVNDPASTAFRQWVENCTESRRAAILIAVGAVALEYRYRQRPPVSV